MKRYIYIGVLMIVAVLVGCQSDKDSTPKPEMFSVAVHVPEEVKANDVFVVEGTLNNDSDHTWEIEHGPDMFTYEVYDSNGELVLEYRKQQLVQQIGIGRSLNPGEAYQYDGKEHVIPANNEIKLQAGSYTVVSQAKFRINYGGNRIGFEIKSEPVAINVT